MDCIKSKETVEYVEKLVAVENDEALNIPNLFRARTQEVADEYYAKEAKRLAKAIYNNKKLIYPVTKYIHGNVDVNYNVSFQKIIAITHTIDFGMFTVDGEDGEDLFIGYIRGGNVNSRYVKVITDQNEFKKLVAMIDDEIESEVAEDDE